MKKAVKEGKIKVTDDFEINVVVLEDGTRVIPAEDMVKTLKFMGLNDDEIKSLLE